MAKDKTNVDDAAEAVLGALDKVTQGLPEAAIAKVLLVVIGIASGAPWLIAAEPLLQRLLERLNNKLGKDAVAAIAAEIKTEEGFKKLATEVFRGQVDPVMRELFGQQAARGAIESGRVIEIVKGSSGDLVARVALLLHRMEERLASPTGLLDPHKPLFDRLVLTGPTTSMSAVARSEERAFDGVRAVTVVRPPKFALELTNMSKVDVRPLAIYVDVIECIDVEIEEVWSWYGMMRRKLLYGVQLEARAGRYRCSPLEAPEDSYLVLRPGELEVFSIAVTVPPTQALYRTRISVECSSAGDTFVQEFERTVQFGVYDPALHPIDTNHPRKMDGPPPDDGGDKCMMEGTATAMAVAAAAAVSRRQQ